MSRPDTARLPARIAAFAVGLALVGAGTAQLVIRAKGSKKRKLLGKGKVRVVPAITFTPTGGTARSQTTKVKLRRR